LVKSGGVIYIEHEVQLAAPPLPSNWQIIKEKHTSALRYFLVQVN
jgi:16S rRNA (guanine966-N2)-methyltransferase